MNVWCYVTNGNDHQTVCPFVYYNQYAISTYRASQKCWLFIHLFRLRLFTVTLSSANDKSVSKVVQMDCQWLWGTVEIGISFLERAVHCDRRNPNLYLDKKTHKSDAVQLEAIAHIPLAVVMPTGQECVTVSFRLGVLRCKDQRWLHLTPISASILQQEWLDYC